jgi:hypothetical protein
MFRGSDGLDDGGVAEEMAVGASVSAELVGASATTLADLEATEDMADSAASSVNVEEDARFCELRAALHGSDLAEMEAQAKVRAKRSLPVSADGRQYPISATVPTGADATREGREGAKPGDKEHIPLGPRQSRGGSRASGGCSDGSCGRARCPSHGAHNRVGRLMPI